MIQPQTDLSTPISFLVENQPSEIIFETQLLEAIDDILSGLGDVNKQAIYRHLKNYYGINENEIPYEIKDFARAIEKIFGPVAKLLEIKIVERLHAKYKDFLYTPKNGELNFVEFAYSLQKYLELET